MLKYLKKGSLKRYAKEYSWTLIDDQNRKKLFMEMVEETDMSYSYKIVLLKANLQNADKEAAQNILSNPFMLFENMNMMRHTNTIGIIEIEPNVRKRLNEDDKQYILKVCDLKPEEYYKK